METIWNIRFYKTRNGDDPITDFILGLPNKDQAKILRSIRLLQVEGIGIREPHAKAIKKNLFELRVIHSSNIQRIFYYLFDGKTFVLLHGFTKKTMKTPLKEIAIAETRRTDDLAQQEEKSHAQKKE